MPGLPHAVERRRAGGGAIGEQLVDLWQKHLILPAPQPVTLLLPGQVADIPADAIHWREASTCVGVAQPFECAPEFAARKAQLQHEWMRHGSCSFLSVCASPEETHVLCSV